LVEACECESDKSEQLNLLELPMKPLVLSRANACELDCVGNCNSCKTNKANMIEACEKSDKTSPSYPNPPKAGGNIIYDFPNN
jgi:hypothetical protein